jgi:hypothetical protein
MANSKSQMTYFIFLHQHHVQHISYEPVFSGSGELLPDFCPALRKTRPLPSVEEPSVEMVASFVRGDGASGVTERESVPDRFDLDMEIDDCFFRRFSDAELGRRPSWPSSKSKVGV